MVAIQVWWDVYKRNINPCVVAILHGCTIDSAYIQQTRVAHRWWWWHTAHRATHLVLIKMEDVQPRNKVPNPARPAPGVRSDKAHEGSRIQYDVLGICGSLTCTAM
jgi:hypothetical protein